MGPAATLAALAASYQRSVREHRRRQVRGARDVDVWQPNGTPGREKDVNIRRREPTEHRQSGQPASTEGRRLEGLVEAKLANSARRGWVLSGELGARGPSTVGKEG